MCSIRWNGMPLSCSLPADCPFSASVPCLRCNFVASGGQSQRHRHVAAVTDILPTRDQSLCMDALAESSRIAATCLVFSVQKVNVLAVSQSLEHSDQRGVARKPAVEISLDGSCTTLATPRSLVTQRSSGLVEEGSFTQPPPTCQG